MSFALNGSEPTLALLEWDSAEFRFPVGRIHGADASEATLAGLLQQSRDLGLNLVYWFSADSNSLAQGSSVLTEFTGSLVTRQATFTKELKRSLDSKPGKAGGVTVVEHPPGPACAELVELGLAAGVESRFRIDPRFPRSAFNHLYATWVQRSTARAVADLVLVARDEREEIVGFVTVKKMDENVGIIGLIAVAPSSRGQGVGRILLEAADEWMIRQALSTVQVITQISNAAACRLYERTGYSLTHVQNIYHFWPQLPML